jgi:hypothetical protein
MKKLELQRAELITKAKNEYCFIKANEDGETEFDTGWCDFTGLWTNKRTELVFEDETTILVDYHLSYALVNCDDFSGELERQLNSEE